MRCSVVHHFLLLGSLLAPSLVSGNLLDSFKEKFDGFFTDEKCLRTPKDLSKLKDLSNWMSKLVGDDDTIKLLDLTLPGSHNSAAYDLTTDLFELDPEFQVTRDGMITLGVPDKYFSSWFCDYALTQSLSISEQLQAGIRYLDLHIDYDGASFRGAHIMFGNSAEDLLLQINTFVKLNTKEIVVVELSPLFADVTSSQFADLQDILLTNLDESLLVPSTTDLYNVTVNELVQAGTRIILVANDEELLFNTTLVWDDSAAILNTLPDTDNLDEMVTYNTEKLAVFSSTEPTSFYKLQWILTPESDYIRSNPLEGSQLKLAEKANPTLSSVTPTYDAETSAMKQIGNILSVDYLDYSNIFGLLGLDSYLDGDFIPEAVEEQSRWTGAAKAGLAAGLVILLCGCCCLAAVCRRRKRRGRGRK